MLGACYAGGRQGISDDRNLDIEKTEYPVLHGERISDERTANVRGAQMVAVKRANPRFRGCPLGLHALLPQASFRPTLM